MRGEFPLPARSSRGEGEDEAPLAPRAFVAYPADSPVIAPKDLAMHVGWKARLGRTEQRLPAGDLQNLPRTLDELAVRQPGLQFSLLHSGFAFR